MTRWIATALFAVLALVGLRSELHAWIGPLDIVLPGLPLPTDVVRVIDNLTKHDSDTTVEVKFGSTVSQGKLLVARMRVDVTLERTSKNWRGQVLVQLVVPSDVSFSVDLSEIRPEHIRLDVKQRCLIIAMPMPKVEDVTPLLTEVKRENTFRRARFKFLDKDTTHQLQNTMLTEDFLIHARGKGAMHVEEIRKEGRDVLQTFLQRLLQGSAPGVNVVVE